MAKFKQKVFQIDAVQFIDTPDNLTEIQNFVTDQTISVDRVDIDNPKIHLYVADISGYVDCRKRDFIIRKPNGTFYPVQEVIFLSEFEEA